MSRFYWFVRIATACSLVSLLHLGISLNPASAADVIVNANGFESPYAPGPLANQQDWVGIGNGPASTAVVQTTTVRSGNQAVKVDRVAESDYYWAVVKNGYPNQRFVYIDWDMSVSQTISNGGSIGPFFGVQAYDYEGGVLFSDYGVLGTLGVDATTSQILYQQGGGGLVASTQTVDFDDWNHFRIILDFTAHRYYGYLNGTPVVTTPLSFVDGTGLNDFTDADIATFAVAPELNSQNATGTAYFDNLVVLESARLLGDYDNDGVVGAGDYTAWNQTFGMLVTPGTGADGNMNGVIDAGDYVIWRSNRGTALLPGAGSGAVTIPEPASIALLLFGGAFLLPRRRQR